MSTKHREPYLDFYKGIAAISIIFIHTAFHSGEAYVPHWFSNLTLLLDVPFFFFLGGWGAGISLKSGKNSVIKTLNSIGKILLKWLFFITFIHILMIALGLHGFSSIIDYLYALCFFNFSIQSLSSVNASIWYMPVYIIVTFWGNFYIRIIQLFHKGDYLFIKNYIFYGICISLIGIIYSSLGGIFFNMSSYFWFYLCFFLIGTYTIDYKIATNTSLLICFFLLIFWGATAKIWHINILNLQSVKFPPPLSLFRCITYKFTFSTSFKGKTSLHSFRLLY